MMQTLVDWLSEIGYNHDEEVDEEDFQEALQSMHETDLDLAALIGKDEPSFRDDRPRKSLHLKDLSRLERDEDYIAELEHFNPEFHPILHVLVDFPLWLLRNRVR